MQRVFVFKPQTGKNFLVLVFEIQVTERQKILREKARKQRKDSSVVQSFYHTKEEAWEDFDEHSQQ